MSTRSNDTILPVGAHLRPPWYIDLDGAYAAVWDMFFAPYSSTCAPEVRLNYLQGFEKHRILLEDLLLSQQPGQWYIASCQAAYSLQIVYCKKNVDLANVPRDPQPIPPEELEQLKRDGFITYTDGLGHIHTLNPVRPGMPVMHMGPADEDDASKPAATGVEHQEDDASQSAATRVGHQDEDDASEPAAIGVEHQEENNASESATTHVKHEDEDDASEPAATRVGHQEENNASESAAHGASSVSNANINNATSMPAGRNGTQCGNCIGLLDAHGVMFDHRGHLTRHCTRNVTDDGAIKACPKCNTRDHEILGCPRETDLREWWHLLVKNRHGKPPFRCPWNLWDMFPKWRDQPQFRPQTALFALQNRGQQNDVGMVVPDPFWQNEDATWSTAGGQYSAFFPLNYDRTRLRAFYGPTRKAKQPQQQPPPSAALANTAPPLPPAQPPSQGRRGVSRNARGRQARPPQHHQPQRSPPRRERSPPHRQRSPPRRQHSPPGQDPALVAARFLRELGRSASDRFIEDDRDRNRSRSRDRYDSGRRSRSRSQAYYRSRSISPARRSRRDDRHDHYDSGYGSRR